MQPLWLSRYRAVGANSARSLQPCRLASDCPNREPGRAKPFLPDRSVCVQASRTSHRVRLLPHRAPHTSRFELQPLARRLSSWQLSRRAPQPAMRRVRSALAWFLRLRVWFRPANRVQQLRRRPKCRHDLPQRLRLPRARVNRHRQSRQLERDRQRPRRYASMIRAPHDAHRQSPGSILGAAA
ncbi:unannotated protein [freshwater metagenome]|uniref:Unannotated protein n=1 Tax=freshwater metagenome TaxID=449393 RepID=A0A6J6P7F2_9ZZZZ